MRGAVIRRSPTIGRFILGALGLLVVWVQPFTGLAETPPGLLSPEENSLTPPPERDWERLGIRESELRILERFHRGGGYEGFHVAYKSTGLDITGVLARPYIPDEDTMFPAIILNHGSAGGVTAPYRAVALDLARRGYVVLASTYRGRAGPEGRSQGLVELAKGEVIDVLQLTQLARKLEYVDPRRVGIMGEGEGGAITLQAIERSNVFEAAVVISPPLFSGMAETGYAGLGYLRERSAQLFGREMPESALIRELYAREMFRDARRIRTPLLFITSNTDLNYPVQSRFVARLGEMGIDHRFLDYEGMFADFMTASNSPDRPSNWNQVRDEAWGEVFRFLAEHVEPGGKPKPESTP